MDLSAEIIQQRIFEDFQLQLSEYYKLCENEYLEHFHEQIILGIINPNDTNYREICYNESKKYKNTLYGKTLTFVKQYINNSFDIIDDSLREGALSKEEAEAAFITLKHILIAAEIENNAVV